MEGAAVLEARARIGTRVRRTPVLRLRPGQLGLPHPALRVKLESMQVTDAFKARGALNSMLNTEIPHGGVVAASGGNHGLAVAWAHNEIRAGFARWLLFDASRQTRTWGSKRAFVSIPS